MRCLVTGVAGFVGSSITDRLLDEGHEVVGVDCFTDYYARDTKEKNIEQARSHSAFTFIENDLLNMNLVELLEGVDWVFHQAAQAGVRASWGELFSTYTNNNILATQRLLEAARDEEIAKTLKKVVYASSSSVYGSAETLPTNEEVLPKPISPYGVTKLAAEHLMQLYSSEFNVPTASLRYFTVYGPRQRPDMAFNLFISAALRGEAITIYGDGEQSRDFTFIQDIVDANIAAAKCDSNDLVCNLGGGSRISVNELIEMLRDIMGSSVQVQHIERQKGDARHTGADVTRAQQALGFSPKVQLRQGLEAEVAWLSDQIK